MSGTEETYDRDELRQAYLALAEEFTHRAHAVRRAREVLSSDSVHQREKMRGREQAWTEAARIARMAAPQ